MMTTINSRKLDGSIHRSWQCQFLEETVDYWLFVGEFERTISHSKLGVISAGTVSYEYYFKHEWFNVFRFHEQSGEFKFYYCNINMPPSFEDSELNYVDLEIDLLVRRDFSFEILDEDEFRENSVRYAYSAELMRNVQESIDSLQARVRDRIFPFDLPSFPLEFQYATKK